MALTLYVEPKKTEITEELVLNELVVDVKDKYTSVKFKNQIILKAKGKATKEEAVEYLKENKSELKKFIEKYKETNKNRIESIKKRSDKRKEIETKIKDEDLEKEVREKLKRKKSKKK